MMASGKKVIENLCDSFEVCLAVCARLKGICLSGHRKPVHREHHRRLSTDIRIQRDDQMGGDDPGEDSVIDVSDDDESEEPGEKIEEPSDEDI
jgi:hypothetical protein